MWKVDGIKIECTRAHNFFLRLDTEIGEKVNFFVRQDLDKAESSFCMLCGYNSLSEVLVILALRGEAFVATNWLGIYMFWQSGFGIEPPQNIHSLKFFKNSFKD